MTTTTSILTNPMLYVVIVALFASLYSAWSLARRQYLGVDKLFNLVTVSLVAGWLAALGLQWLINQQPLNHIMLADLWVHPRSMMVLAGYTGIAIVATRYIMKIRYPYWRTMDMLAISLAIFEAVAIVGWSLTQLGFGSLVAAMSSIASVGILFAIYFKVDRHGLVSGIHLVLFFSTALSARLLVPSWQETMTGVEWLLDISGIVIGVVLTILRISAKSEKVILQDIPRGVSQGFQETFTRAFKNKQLSKKQ